MATPVVSVAGTQDNSDISHLEEDASGSKLHRTIDTSWRRFFQDMWDYRQVLYFMVWRDFIVRYKQTHAGLWWAVLNPVLGLLVYWWAFGVVANLQSDGAPYALFIFAGLIPFTFVSEYISRAVYSLTDSSDLIQKVFFPRIFAPLSALVICLVDLSIMLAMMLALMVLYGYWPTLRILAVPLFLAMAVIMSLGVGLALAALNVSYRDVSRATGLLVRLLMFASPVFYSHDMVPPTRLWVYDLNPLSAVIQGFRWSLLSSAPLDAVIWARALLICLATLLVGIVLFRKVDRTVADTL